MTDYTKRTGSNGTMMIRDTGSTVEFWITTSSPLTWTDHLPWSGTVNGGYVGGAYNYQPATGWNRIGSWGVSYSQNVTFNIGDTTVGFGGPTSFTVYISRATVPPAPNAPVLSSITSTSMYVEFTGNGDGGAGVIYEWQVGYSTDPNGPTDYVSTYTFLLSPLEPGTTYYFWARGRNYVGWGPWSARSEATTLRVPDPPTNPAISNVGPTSLRLTFAPNGNGGASITGFEIGYGTNSEMPTTIVSATSPKTITGLIPGTTYYFWARAINSVGPSPWSGSSSTGTIAGAYIKVGGVWKVAIPYVKVSGIWRLAHPLVRDVGAWKDTV